MSYDLPRHGRKTQTRQDMVVRDKDRVIDKTRHVSRDSNTKDNVCKRSCISQSCILVMQRPCVPKFELLFVTKPSNVRRNFATPLRRDVMFAEWCKHRWEFVYVPTAKLIQFNDSNLVQILDSRLFTFLSASIFNMSSQTSLSFRTVRI